MPARYGKVIGKKIPAKVLLHSGEDAEDLLVRPSNVMAVDITAHGAVPCRLVRSRTVAGAVKRQHVPARRLE